MANFKDDYPRKYILVLEEGDDVTPLYETATLDEMLEQAKDDILEFKNDDGESWSACAIWELPKGRVYRLPDGKASNSKLTDAEMIRIAKQKLALQQQSVGLLGRYFYKYRVLHYGGMLLYIALGMVSIYFLVDDVMHHTFNWVNFALVIAYLGVSPAVYNETKEVHDIWREQRFLNQFE